MKSLFKSMLRAQIATVLSRLALLAAVLNGLKLRIPRWRRLAGDFQRCDWMTTLELKPRELPLGFVLAGGFMNGHQVPGRYGIVCQK